MTKPYSSQNDEYQFMPDQFACPPDSFAPVYSWLWNGRLSRAEITRQLDEMLSGDIRAFYVIPEPKEFRPQTMVTELEPPYLSDEFMDYIRFTAEQAKARGMRMWLYDEGGWPSGGAAGQVVAANPSAQKKRLARAQMSFAEAKKHPGLAGIFCMDGTKAAPDTEDTAQVMAYYTEKLTGQVADADILEPGAMDTFITLTHEKYAAAVGDEFGKNIPLLFTDEPSPAIPAWPRDIEERFREAYGYDITDHLPCLFEPGLDDKARLDYQRLVDTLFRERFMDRQRAWCHAHGLSFTGHLGGEHTLPNYKEARFGDYLYLLRGMDVPGVDVIWRQIFPYAQGYNTSDSGKDPVCPSGAPDDTLTCFPRVASSAARQNGTRDAVAECFGVFGTGVTFAQMLFVTGFLAVRGINRFNMMDISFARDRYFVFAERPLFHAENPNWNAMPAFNEALARMSWLLAQGTRVCDTALYMPYEAGEAGGAVRNAAVQAVQAATDRLDEAQTDFDLINLRGLTEGEIRGGVLCLGDAAYTRIVVPEGIELPAEARKKLAQLRDESSEAVRFITPQAGMAHPKALRIQRREYANGDRLLLLFNEGRAETNCILTLPVSAHAYWLDPASGAVRQAECVLSGILCRIPAGQLTALLLSSSEIPALPVFRSGTVQSFPITACEQAVEKRFILSSEGMTYETPDPVFTPCVTGQWSDLFGRDFSGVVCYRLRFDAPKNARGEVRLRLNGLHGSAVAELNGCEIGTALAEPWELAFDAALLKEKNNELRLHIANTPANQYVFSGADKMWEPKQLSPYHTRSLCFERDSLFGGIDGPIQVIYASTTPSK